MSKSLETLKIWSAVLIIAPIISASSSAVMAADTPSGTDLVQAPMDKAAAKAAKAALKAHAKAAKLCAKATKKISFYQGAQNKKGKVIPEKWLQMAKNYCPAEVSAMFDDLMIPESMVEEIKDSKVDNPFSDDNVMGFMDGALLAPAAVAEPGTLALLGGGLLAFRFRKRGK